ncbi:MAG: hypothetical protein M3Y12_06630 [Bacteroidota bacterium]|nr:hypothetical protein [Bacteroidota bacterium]
MRAVGSGRVREQSLAPDSPIKRGDLITLTLEESGPRIAAPTALPEPEHTDLAENKLLVPVDMEPAKARKSFADGEKAHVQAAVAERSAGVKPNAKASRPTARPAATTARKPAATGGTKAADKSKDATRPSASDKNAKKTAAKAAVRRT